MLAVLNAINKSSTRGPPNLSNNAGRIPPSPRFNQTLEQAKIWVFRPTVNRQVLMERFGVLNVNRPPLHMSSDADDGEED